MTACGLPLRLRWLQRRQEPCPTGNTARRRANSLLNEALRTLPAGTGQSGSDGFIERLLERDSPRLHAIAEQPLDVRIEGNRGSHGVINIISFQAVMLSIGPGIADFRWLERGAFSPSRNVLS